MIQESTHWSQQLNFQIDSLYNHFAQSSKPNLYELTDQVHSVCAQIFHENYNKINLKLFIKQIKVMVEHKNRTAKTVHVNFSKQFVTKKIQEIAQTISIKPQSLDDLTQTFEEIYNILIQHKENLSKDTAHEARKYFIRHIQDVIIEFEKCNSSQTFNLNIKNDTETLLNLKRTINKISIILQTKIKIALKMNTQADVLTGCLYQIISNSYELKHIPLLDSQLEESIKHWIESSQEEDLSEFEIWISKNLSKNLLPEPYRQLKASINHIYKKFKECK